MLNNDLLETLLDALAVCEDSLTLSQLAALANLSNMFGGRRQSSAAIQRIFEPMVRSGKVLYTGRMSLPKDSSERRVRSLWRAGEYADVSALLEMVAPSVLNPKVGQAPRLGTLNRSLRTAMLAQDSQAIERLLPHAQPELWRWFAEPLASDMIRALTPRMQGWVCHTLAQQSLAQGVALAELAALVARLAPRSDDGGLHAAGTVLCVLMGDWPGADRHAGKLTGYLGTQAFYALTQHDIEGSAQLYAKHLAGYRKEHGPKAIPTDFESLFLPLAFSLSVKQMRKGQALRMHALAQETGLTKLGVHQAWPHLQALQECRPPQPGASTHPIVVLIEALTHWWQGLEMDGERVQAAAVSADALGWPWIAEELRAGVEGEDLFMLREVRSEWEQRLDNLEMLLAQGTISVGGRASVVDRRVGWLLKEQERQLDLGARLQSLREGRWSIGRPIANERLLALDKKLPLSPQDKEILLALKRHVFRGYGGKAETSYSWDSQVAWQALVGHPAVFAESGQPLTIVAGQPRLLKQPTESGDISLSLRPLPNLGAISVFQAGNGYQVTTFTKQEEAIATLLREGLLVPEEAAPRLEEVLESAPPTLTPSAEEEVVDGDPRIVVLLRPARGAVSAELVVQPLGESGPRFAPGQGAEMVVGRVHNQALRARRDLELETQLQGKVLELPGLAQAIQEEGRWVLGDTEAALSLLAALQAAEILTFWPEERTLHLRGQVGAAGMSLKVGQVGSWFQASGTLQVDGETVAELQELLDAVLSAQGRFVQLKDGSFVALERRLREDLLALARASKRDAQGVSVHPLASLGLEALADSCGARTSTKFRAHLRKLREPPTPPPIPAGLQATLRDYQVQGFEWLTALAHIGAGGILADDMGLGKTMTTLTLLLHRQGEGPALVIAPTSVAGNWAREIERFAPSLSVLRLRDASDREAMIFGAQSGQVLLCSYGLLVSEQSLLDRQFWGTVVLDESQALKNASTQRHQAAASLSAGMKLALTGTPIENHLGELHAQLSLLNPGMLGSAGEFRRRFQRPIEAGDDAVREQLRALVSPYLLRRTKEQVLDELPARTDIDLPVELNAEEAALYEAIRLSALQELQEREGEESVVAVLAHLSRLRLLACSPKLVDPGFTGECSKLAAFSELALSLMDNGHRALVFSQFVKHLKLLREWLDFQGIPYQYLDGGTPAKKRDQAVREFQSGHAPFFLISTKAGGQGLNLTAADYVLHMDPWWNPAVEDQASDRAHRLGQQRPVTVYRVYAKGTVEEQILELHRSKRALADGILDGADIAGRLSAGQLMELMQQGVGG